MMTKEWLVTGANSGLGLETVRQLALLPETKRIYMACRSKQKASNAMESLVAVGINKNLLKYVHFDGSQSMDDIANDVRQLVLAGTKLDGVILNAGGVGNDTSGKPSGPNNVLDLHQINLIGHAQFLELLVRHKILAAKGCRVIFSGTEAARGAAALGIAAPEYGSTNSWYESVLTGSSKSASSYNAMKELAVNKGIAALYLAAWARRHPTIHVLTVSPGGTSGTSASKSDAVPKAIRFIMSFATPVLKAVGLMHNLEDGAARYVNALTTANVPSSGTFLASMSGTTGRVGDQTALQKGKQFGDTKKQEAAYAAVSVFIEKAESLVDDDEELAA